MFPDTPQTLLRKIAEYANGDDASEWARFVELYEPVIRIYITQFGDAGAADADDIVQDIFIRLVDVLRKGEYKPEKGRFRNYLASMVRRLLIDRHRRAVYRGAGLEADVDHELLESDVIKGMTESLKRNKPLIMIEIRNYLFAEINDILQSIGYNHITIDIDIYNIGNYLYYPQE